MEGAFRVSYGPGNRALAVVCGRADDFHGRMDCLSASMDCGRVEWVRICLELVREAVSSSGIALPGALCFCRDPAAGRNCESGEQQHRCARQLAGLDDRAGCTVSLRDSAFCPRC